MTGRSYSQEEKWLKKVISEETGKNAGEVLLLQIPIASIKHPAAAAQGEDASLLRAHRKRRKLTLAELSRKAGVNEGYISQLEGGRRRGSIDIYKKLAAALGVPVSELLRSE